MEEPVENGRKKKQSRNPFKAYHAYRLRKKLEKERILLAREERMKEDLERYLMQMEEQRCWLAYHLRHVNAQRMRKLQVLRRIQQNEQKKDDKQTENSLKEDGLNFYQGNVVNYQRWQNSPAKYRDFCGHKDAVTACRLSPCKKYVLSCSADTSMKIWDLVSAECIKTYHGHAKVVNDADMHPAVFKMYSLTLNIVSASGDGTIRLWNTSDTKPITTIFAHQSAVYRCMFSPDGHTIISCSEDKTIKTWNYPEGYNIFVYSAHNSPVISLRYSPSGRYFISGSDYGERKIILWDAKFPHMHEPAKFPHIIYWTTTGLIKKIIIRRDNPRTGFWLAQNQLTWISNDKNLDIWAGELSDDDNFAEDQDSDGEEGDDDDDDEGAPKKQEKVDLSRQGDIYEKDGVFINVLQVGKNGEKDSAVEYQPGGSLVVQIQSAEYYIEEAYLGAYVKDSMLDIYSPESGRRAGSFVLDAPIPWLPMLSKIDSTGRKIYHRSAPEYVTMSKDGVSINYLPEKGKRKIVEAPEDEKEGDGKKASVKDGFEIVWNCPEPQLGIVVLVFSFKLKGHESNWLQLRYSMKESPLRQGEYAIFGEKKLTDEAKQFNFNQEKKHANFWNFIRDKNWTAAASYIDKYAVAWVREDVVRRRFRIMNLLCNMFENVDWMILHSPFQFNPGVTKSVVLCESEYGEYDEEDEEDEEKDNKQENSTGGKNSDKDSLGDSNRISGDNEIEYEESAKGKDATPEKQPMVIKEGVPPSIPEKQNESIAPEQEIPALEKEAVVEDKPLEPTIEYRFSGSVDEDNNDEDNVQENDDKFGEEDVDRPGSGESNVGETEANEDEDAWLETTDDVVAAAGRFRPHTQPQHLPSVIFTKMGHKSMDKDALEAEADRLAKEETKLVLSFLSGGTDIVQELPLTAQRGAVLELLPKPNEETVLDNNSQQMEKHHTLSEESERKMKARLRPIDFDAVMDLFDKLSADYKHLGMLSPYEQSEYAKQLKAKDTLFPSELESLDGAPVVKSGRFGPEIDEFSMPLPALYPIQAGAAKYALRPGLEWFQRIMRKVKVESLPKTMREVYEPTWKEKMQTWYHKLNRTQDKFFQKKLHEVLKDYLLSQFMQEMAYVSTRRPTFHQLPGLVPHYPNPHYPNPAVVTPETAYPPPVKNTVSSFVDMVLGRPVNKSIMVPPVGRKPDKEKAFELQRQAYSALSQTANRAVLRPMKSQFQVNVLDNLIEVEDNGKGKLSRSKSKSANLKKGKSKQAMLKTALVDYPVVFNRERRAFYHTLPGLEEFATDAIKSQHAVPMGEEEDIEDDEEFEWQPPPGMLRVFTIKDGLELAHHGAINDVVFSPSELRIASAGGDSLVKIWDPRDGSFVRSLVGHEAEVISVKFTSSEQFLISAGGDAQIIIWSLLTQTIQRRMRGHVDVITMLDLVPDGSLILSASQDHTLKTWYTTPRHPVAPDPPKIISFTERSIYLGWSAPPSFNCDITAFHYQYRVGTRGDWMPENGGQSVAPHLRNRVIDNIIPATPYQFRICAENTMGRSDWSSPSVLVKTAFGLPEPVERPFVSLIARTAQHIIWFTPNPTTYGSAATSFEIQYAGNGKSYEENPTLRLDLSNVQTYGEKVLGIFQKIRQRRDELKHKLIKSQQFHMRTRQLPEDKAIYEVSEALPSETVFEILDRAEEESFLLVGCEVSNLRPGFLYTIRVRGSNVVGMGKWSVPTLSTATKPTIPDTPNPPRLAQASLRSLTFQWDPPHDDGGTAITGYRLHLISIDRYIELGRSSVTYKWSGLFPGRSYRCRVLARNVVGESPFSDPNSEQDSFTQTAPPDTPQNPVAVEGTWSALVFEADIPYHNGARVTEMEYEYRRVEPFNIGEWIPCKRPLSVRDETKDVVFVHRVDLDKQQSDMEEAVKALELAARSMKKTPMPASSDSSVASKEKRSKLIAMTKKKGNKPDKTTTEASSTSAATASSLEQQIETLILSQRPVGHRIRFTIDDLDQDAMFEIRIRFANAAGIGVFSAPSHRAKTNKAALPGACEPPEIVFIGSSYLILELKIPSVEGGATIRTIHIENVDLDDNRTTTYKCLRNNAIDGVGLSAMESYRMENLIPGHSFLLRCRAESAVGFGPFSAWTKEVTIPNNDQEAGLVEGMVGGVGISRQGTQPLTVRTRSVDSRGGAGGAGGGAGPGISRTASTADSVSLAGDTVSALSSPSQSVASSRVSRKQRF